MMTVVSRREREKENERKKKRMKEKLRRLKITLFFALCMLCLTLAERVGGWVEKEEEKEERYSVIWLEFMSLSKISIATTGLFSTNSGSILGVMPLWYTTLGLASKSASNF